MLRAQGRYTVPEPSRLSWCLRPQVTRRPRKPFVVPLLLAALTSFGQQPPEKTAAERVCTLTAVPAGKILKRVMPVLPKEMTAKAITEGVDVELTIDRQGVPRDLQVTKGDPVLAKAVLEALQQWRWKPYELNGEAVEVESSVYVRFEPARE